MSLRLDDRDLWAGVVFVAIGAAALVAGADLTAGSATEMGEGYVPRAMAVALAALGVAIAALGWRRGAHHDSRVERVRLRPLFFVTAAVLAFVAAVESLGLVAAVAASVTAASFAGEPLRPRSLAILICALVIFVLAVFVWGLGLPLRVLPRPIG